MNYFAIQQGNVFAVPVIHNTMELAMEVKKAFDAIQPDCVAVEIAQNLELTSLHAASRLPDISVIVQSSKYYLCENCDAAFEGLRLALEHHLPAHCIDLDVENYPQFQDRLPDPYAISKIGLKAYYEAYLPTIKDKHPLDQKREFHMARRLKELALSHDKVLFVGGFHHVHSVLELMHLNAFPEIEHAPQKEAQLCTLTEDSARDVMAEYGWIANAYETWRQKPHLPLDRQQCIFQLYKAAATRYTKTTGNAFLGYHLRNTMKFARNWALWQNKLMPNLFEVLTCAKGCVDHNYAYEVWYLASDYLYRKNIDNLPELNLSVDEVWGASKRIFFHLKQKQRKGLNFKRRQKDRSNQHFHPPSPYSICSHPPEDLIIENFAQFLKEKGSLVLRNEMAHSLPFSTSLEDGIDIRETIRHWYEKKLYVKVQKSPLASASSLVLIFDEDDQTAKYPWKTTWIGEHNQESDMAFYATPTAQNIVGPGISRCEYGGLMMSSPPRRLDNVWHDPDYAGCQTKAELLLMAAIDYSLKSLVIYVSKKAPRTKMRQFANRFGKKIVYIPIGGLSQVLLNKIRAFHVLDGHDRREIAGDYIF